MRNTSASILHGARGVYRRALCCKLVLNFVFDWRSTIVIPQVQGVFLSEMSCLVGRGRADLHLDPVRVFRQHWRAIPAAKHCFNNHFRAIISGTSAGLRRSTYMTWGPVSTLRCFFFFTRLDRRLRGV